MGLVIRLDTRAPVPEKEPSDVELLAGTRAGDLAAREALFRRHYPRILRRLHRLLGRQDEAEDLAQEVCLEIFRSLDRLRNDESFTAWAGRIVVFRARSTIRRHAMLRRLGLRGQAPIDPDHVISGSAPADVASELRCIYAHLNSMPVDVRTALVLRRVEGLTIDEIAAQMKRSPATVKRRIEEGRVLLERWGTTYEQEGES